MADESDWRDMRDGEGEWLCWGDPVICRPPTTEEARARAIRAVVAAQVGGMVMLIATIALNKPDELDDDGGVPSPRTPIDGLFPTPEQIVDGET